MGPVDLAGHVGRGVPARIGEADEIHVDGEGPGQDLPGGLAGGGEGQSRGMAEDETGDDDAQDEEDLEGREGVLEAGARGAVQGVDGGDGGDDGQGDPGAGRHSGQSAEPLGQAQRRGQIAAQGDRRGRHGSGESHEQRDPAGHEAQSRMEHAGQEMILAAAAREEDAGLGIGQRAEQGQGPAHDPQHENGQPRGLAGHLEAQAGEDARPDHVGDDERGGRIQAVLGAHQRISGAAAGFLWK